MPQQAPQQGNQAGTTGPAFAAGSQGGSQGSSNPFDQPTGFDQEATQPASAFGGAVATSAPVEISRPPVLLLFIALGIAIVAGVIAAIVGALPVAIICWFLAGPVAIGIIAFYVNKDNDARAKGVYSAPNWVRPLHIAVSVICVLAVVVPALRIADWVGRL